MHNEMKTSFLAKPENVIYARTIAVGFLLNLNLEMGVLNEIKTVISEAVTNAIVHGYGSDPSEWVHLNMKYDDEAIEMEVIDHGIGIEDVEKAKEPLYSTKVDEERAGLGFTIMEVFTDWLDVFSTPGMGTTVKMKKKILCQVSKRLI